MPHHSMRDWGEHQLKSEHSLYFKDKQLKDWYRHPERFN